MFQRKRPKRIFQSKDKSRLPISLIVIGLLTILLFLVPTTRIDQAGFPAVSTPSPTLLPINTPLPAPTFTPLPLPTGVHGGRIVFTCTRGDFNQLCLINRDGSGLLQLTDERANHYYPIFSPHGEAILYASNRSQGTFDLYTMIMSTSKVLQLTNEIGNVFSPDFSPDGETVLFINRTLEGQTGLWVMKRDGSNPRLLFGGPNYAGPNTLVAAAWSPDGMQIAMAITTTQSYEYEIFLMDADGKEAPRLLTLGLLGISGSLDWSPDGRYLLLAAGPPGDKDIFRYDNDTGAIARLTFGGNNNSPAYSPDGQWIAFNSLRIGEQADIYVMRSDGSNLRQLTNNPEPDWQPQWEP